MRRLIIFLVSGFVVMMPLKESLAASHPQGFLSEISITLPKNTGVTAEWLENPLSDATMDKMPLDAPGFAVGLKDNPWFLLKPQTLVNPEGRYHITLETPLSDIGVLDEGIPIAVSKDGLGVFIFENKDDGIKAAFQPVFALPFSNARIAVGVDDVIYIFGFNERSGFYEIYLMKSETLTAKDEETRGVHVLYKIFSSSQKITAVAGNGQTTFVATGRMILRLPLARGTASLYFVHPREEILELAGNVKTGLFYATGTGVGIISPKGPKEFIKAANTSIRYRNDALYVFLKNNFSVVKIKNADSLCDVFSSSQPSK
jgi:hypothetical protein